MDDRAAAGTGAIPGIPASLAVAAVAVALGVSLASIAVLRVPLAYDAPVAIVFTVLLEREVALGAVWPRWLFDGNVGFGSPAFYFYPPLSYIPPVALSLLTGAAAVTSLALSAMAWRILAFGTAYLWMRAFVGVRAALIGASLSMLMPYVAVANPFMRFAYAELAASALLPLILLASHRSPIRSVVETGVLFALLILCHVPTALLMTICAPAYAVLRGEGRIARTGAVIAGICLGALAASAYLLPALSLLDLISPEQWNPGGRGAAGSLLPELGPLADLGFIWDKRFPWFVGLNSAFYVTIAVLLLSLSRGWRRQPNGLAVYLTAALTLLLMSKLAIPFWSHAPVFPRVQFPWRMLTISSLLAGASVALLVERQGVTARALRVRLLAVLAVVSAALAAGLAVLPVNTPIDQPVRLTVGDVERQERLLKSVSAHPAEYWPPQAVPYRLRLQDPATVFQGWTGLDRLDHVTSVAHGAFAAGEPALLGQFWFPGVTATAGGLAASAGPDPATGLIVVRPAAAATEIVIRRGRTDAERQGLWLSGLGVVLLGGTAAFAMRRRDRRASPGMA